MAAIVYALIKSISEVSRHCLKLCQQTEHALLEYWKSTSTSPNPSPLSACYPLGRNFVGRDHWSLFFWEKRARCHGECCSIQGDDRRIFPSTSGRNVRRGCVVSTRRSHGPRWNCWESTSLAASSLSKAISLGRRNLQIWLHATSCYGVIWSLSFTTINHGP